MDKPTHTFFGLLYNSLIPCNTPQKFQDKFHLVLENLLSLFNKPKGLKVAKEELRSIGLMVDRLDGRQARWAIGSTGDRPDGQMQF